MSASVNPIFLPALAVFGGPGSKRAGFDISAEAARHYRIESSSDLLTWTPERTFIDRPQPIHFAIILLVSFTNRTAPATFRRRSIAESKVHSGFNLLPQNELCNLYLKQLRFAKDAWFRGWKMGRVGQEAHGE